MSEPTSRLPARPSLEQLRKQAKELLRSFHSADPEALQRLSKISQAKANGPTKELTLSDAQFTLAREHGFGSWAELVHHIQTNHPPGLADYEQLAQEIARAYTTGDALAIREINWTHGTGYVWDHEPELMQQRLPRWFSSELRSMEIALDDARHLVAKQSGADSWQELVQSFSDNLTSNNSATRPSRSRFYQINEEERRIDVRGPVSKKDWEAVFDVMREMKLTTLAAGSQMTDVELELLSLVPDVERVELSSPKHITYQGLKHLARLPIHSLELGGWGSRVDDDCLRVLADLPELRHLSLAWAHSVTDKGIAYATSCNKLEAANLMATRTGDGALRALGGKSRLFGVTLGTRVTRDGIALLHNFPMFVNALPQELVAKARSEDHELTHVTLDPSPFANGGLEGLAGLAGLFSLRLFSVGDSVPPVNGNTLLPATKLPALQSLWCDPTDDAMRVIAEIPRLRKLMCQDTDAGDDGWVALSASRTLENIWGRRNSGLTARGFAAMSRMPALKNLGVNLQRVDHETLALLEDFPALRELTPVGVGDAGFVHVGKCVDLQSLTCMYTNRIGDAAIDYLANLRKLRRFYAGETTITDRSLEILAKLPELESVELWSCTSVTDAGVQMLASAPKLKRVTLDGLPYVSRNAARFFPSHVTVHIG